MKNEHVKSEFEFEIWVFYIRNCKITNTQWPIAPASWWNDEEGKGEWLKEQNGWATKVFQQFTAELMPTSENENEIKPTDDYYHIQMHQKKGSSSRRRRK